MNKDELAEKLKNDPFIKIWNKNYNQNFREGLFSTEDARPLSLLIRNKPYWGLPTVLVAAGPSLDKNILNLKEYQKKAIILVADVVFYKLVENDIIPDFVINIDPSNMFVRFWRDLDTSISTLVCPTTANPDAIKTWQGKKVFFNQLDVPKSAKGEALKRLVKPTEGFGSIFNQFFVGATMLQIASLFNPKPAILMGYDFAYTGGKAYCDGFLDRKIYDDTLPPGSPEQLEHIRKLRAGEVKANSKVPDIYGIPLITNRTLIFYRDSFLNLIHKSLKLRHIVNCTEGGILTGVPNRKLKDVLSDCCKDEISKKNIFQINKRKRKKKGRR